MIGSQRFAERFGVVELTRHEAQRTVEQLRRNLLERHAFLPKRGDQCPYRVTLVQRLRLDAIDNHVVASEVSSVRPDNAAFPCNLLLAQPDLIVLCLRQGNHLVDVDVHLAVQLIRRKANTADIEAIEAVEPLR